MEADRKNHLFEFIILKNQWYVRALVQNLVRIVRRPSPLTLILLAAAVVEMVGIGHGPGKHSSVPAPELAGFTGLQSISTARQARDEERQADSMKAVLAMQPKLVMHSEIWHGAPHCAFTDLIRYKGVWFCVFRESLHHVSADSSFIRIIKSLDGENWEPTASFTEEGYDVRDPKLCVTPNGRLMLTYGNTPVDTIAKGKDVQTKVTFSTDGRRWSRPRDISIRNQWAWGMTWYGEYVYTVAYNLQRGTELYRSDDGIHFESIARFELPELTNETALQFLPDSTLIAYVRHETRPKSAYIGKSRPPYTNWTFEYSGMFLGGAQMITLPDKSVWIGGRILENGQGRTILAKRDENGYFGQNYYLPSGGDNAYPGMVWHDDQLWMSYYSTDRDSTRIFLARLQMPLKQVVERAE